MGVEKVVIDGKGGERECLVDTTVDDGGASWTDGVWGFCLMIPTDFF